jgi:CRP-like cAMP-binding protein
MTGIAAFKEFISQFPHYTEGAFELAKPYLQEQTINKGEHILRQGSKCHDIHFVISGMFKVYYLRDGVSVTSCFCKEGRFTTSYRSLISSQPSELNIQATEPAETVRIAYEDLKKLYSQDLFWQQIGRLITEQEYLVTECYTRLINDTSAKQRYLNVLENEPDLLQRVSLADLASYLQVTPETISRIRRQLATS